MQNFIKQSLLLIILFYQKILSPDHSIWAKRMKFKFCRFSPSCSEFTKIALIKHGLFKGLVMGVARILRCNPFSKKGFDPVPENFSLERNHNYILTENGYINK